MKSQLNFCGETLLIGTGIYCLYNGSAYYGKIISTNGGSRIRVKIIGKACKWYNLNGMGLFLSNPED